jgi:2-C-methyl-D-erythritol 4-phosphate cytidylyltransferase
VSGWPEQDVVAIVLAAGRGRRLGLASPKAFLELDGEPLLVRAVRGALSCGEVGSVVVAVPGALESQARDLIEPLGAHAVVAGASTRQGSVRAALAAIPEDAGRIVCHDAARPFASPALFDAVIEGLAGFDGVVPVVAVLDTVKRVRGGIVVATEPRQELGLAQTPQAFVASALREAHRRAEADGRTFTDDAAVLEWAGYRVGVVPGEPGNFKVTFAEDLARAEALLGRAGGRVG